MVPYLLGALVVLELVVVVVEVEVEVEGVVAVVVGKAQLDQLE